MFAEVPVPRFGPPDEERLLQGLAQQPPQTVLVVSDLHLAYGQDAATGRYPRTENFLADAAFVRMLQHATPGAADALLVFNGDTFDFLRICTIPQENELEAWSMGLKRLGVQPVPTSAQLRARIDAKERHYGLGTEDFKCVWKLWQIAAGHGAFFDALGAWLDRGGRILFVKGNHDVELYWPLVRLALREILAARAGGSAQAAADRVVFCDDFTRIANLHLEHGHQYEKPTQVIGSPVLATAPSQLRLPLGSFINRYLVNPAEQVEPFLDNVRPLTRYVLVLLRRHPRQALRLVWRAWPFVVRSFRTPAKLDAFGIILPLISLILLAAVGLGLLLYRKDPGLLASGWRPWLMALGLVFAALGFTAPHLVVALLEWLTESKKKPKVAEDRYADHAYAELKKRPVPRVKVLYAVYGHTHNQDAQELPPIQGTPVLYLNTGTWIPLFIEDRPDLMGRAFHPFIRFTMGPGDEYRHEYLEWSDDRNAPVAAVITGPDPRSRRAVSAPASAEEEDVQGAPASVGH